MLVQNYLREKGLQSLVDEFAIRVKEYPEYGLYKLNYDQIESPKNHPIVNECRALILDKDWNVVSRSFDRFFNYGECNTVAEFSFDNVTVFEKADGSLCPVYFCPQSNRWEISTRGSCFAEVPHVFGAAGVDKTFREMILGAMNFADESQFQGAMAYMPTGFTYVMEYTSPFNRIVTPYEIPQMVLLGIVGNATGIEVRSLETVCDLLVTVGMNVRLPEVYNLSSGDECLKAVKELPSMQEGYVVLCNNTGKRVKMKSPGYVAIHHLRGNGNLTFENIAELILLDEHEEYLTYFDTDRPLFNPVIEAREKLDLYMTLIYNQHKDIESQKEFAMQVKDYSFAWVMFEARKKHCSPTHAFNEGTMSKKISLLEKFSKEQK